jgi:TRAP-type C4-dicarboxylate transport system permease large subunit
MYTHAAIILAVIAGVFFLARWFKITTELSIFAAAVAGGIAHTGGIPVRHLVEGTFTYFDICLIFITATVFINLLKEAGGISFMVRSIIKTFHDRKYLCLLLLTVVLLIPGALTGAGAATVLTVGTLVGTVLTYMGISKTRTTAIIFVCATMSAAAPPVNLWAMMTAAGANMPYVGFMQPLFVLSVTGALLAMFILGGKGEPVDLDKALSELPKPPEDMNWFRVILPFAVFFILVLAGRLWPFNMPILGLPLMFIIAAIVVIIMTPRRLPILDIIGQTLRSLIPLVGIMIVVGSLIQVMALSGARGLVSLGVVTLPLWFLFISLWAILPVAQGVFQYAVAPLLGVPLIFLFNMEGLNPIIALSAMAVMWPLGDGFPPTAVVGRAAVIELDYEGRYYKDFLKTASVPMLIILGICSLFLVFSNQLSFLVGG